MQKVWDTHDDFDIARVYTYMQYFMNIDWLALLMQSRFVEPREDVYNIRTISILQRVIKSSVINLCDTCGDGERVDDGFGRFTPRW